MEPKERSSDKAAQEMISRMAEAGQQNAWDRLDAQSPQCGFVLMDKLEQMDMETLSAFDAWTRSQGLQVIATRVSSGSECSIIIEDGLQKSLDV